MNFNLRKRIKIKCFDHNFEQDHEFTEDEARLRMIFAMHGYELSLDNAEQLWWIHSNSLDAIWSNLHEDDDVVWKEILPFWEEDKSDLL